MRRTNAFYAQPLHLWLSIQSFCTILRSLLYSVSIFSVSIRYFPTSRKRFHNETTVALFSMQKMTSQCTIFEKSSEKTNLLYTVTEFSTRKFVPKTFNCCKVGRWDILYFSEVHKVPSLGFRPRKHNKGVTGELVSLSQLSSSQHSCQGNVIHAHITWQLRWDFYVSNIRSVERCSLGRHEKRDIVQVVSADGIGGGGGESASHSTGDEEKSC
mmetsp:Transcript_31292/g.62983  ORF Transcript_31292/g.62983 Transcript_31292/m.62983 type:complete len:213 (+) Transcript_31292:347-985(+)